MKDKRTLLVILEIALWSFVFLGTEYLFDNICATFMEQQDVVVAQNAMLGISAVGFLLYGFLQRFARASVRKNLEIIMVVVGIGLLCAINLSTSCPYFLIESGMLFIIFGLVGGKIFYYASTHIVEQKYLARISGLGYAAGIFIQFLNTMLFSKRAGASTAQVEQAIVFAAGFAVMIILVNRLKALPEGQGVNEHVEMKSSKNAVLSLLIVTVLLTLIFSTLDNAITLAHVAGSIDVGQWPRLILALSGLVAGILFDLAERKYMPLMMLLMAILSVSCIVVLQLGGSVLMALIFFYISAGFFVVFFMTAFMETSYYTMLPQLWAGFGRAVNNICALLLTALSLTLLSRETPIMVLVLALLLLVGICITGFLFYHYRKPQEIAKSGG